MSDNSKKMNRSEFLKIMGAAALATTAANSCAGSGGSTKSSTTSSGEREAEMTTRTSAHGDKVAILGYGGTKWPLLENPEPGKSVVDQAAVDELIDHAIAHGVNYFDTAPPYSQGWSEDAVGRSLSRYPRDKFLIGTKMSSQYNTDPTAFREYSLNLYYNSFKALRVDYFDYYMLHSIGRTKKSFNERFIDSGILDFLLEERKAGRIRHLGWSFHGNKETFDWIMAMHETVHWDFVLIQLNYADWQHATGANVNAEYLTAELDKRNIQALVMEPLRGGRLVAALPDHITERLKRRNPEKSVGSWAFRFSASHNCVLTVLSGMTYMEHLKDNIDTFSPLEPLSEEEFEFMEQTADLLSEYPTVDCNDCLYCMPCPYGLDIPGIFAHYNKCVNDGNIVSSTDDSEYRKARRAYLVSYDRAIPTRRQADRCIGCGECIHHCPQGIDIPGQLNHISSYIEKLRQDRF